MSAGDEVEEEDGLNLDNDSPAMQMLQSDEGVPITGFDGQPAFVTPEEARRLRGIITTVHYHYRACTPDE
jgi:hypothetical protein